MDVPETDEKQRMNWSISLHFIYGFLTLLAICIFFSLVKAIYHFYKRKAEPNEEAESAENSTTIESQSVSSRSPRTERQSENNVTESDRLNVQLDKLRKLLNRLNAMGTFSRDTIGDLSAPSVSNINRSGQALSDLSEFWSSIDFDEFEDSAVNEGNLQKTLTDNSISVSDFSLDVSGMNCKQFSHNNLAVFSNESLRKAPLNRTNPTEAIAQILSILDSIMMKNRLDVQASERNRLPINIKTNESIITNNLPPSARSEKFCLPQERSIISDSSVSMDKTISSTNKSMCSDTLITTPGSDEFEIKENTEVRSGILPSKLKWLDHMSKAMESKNIYLTAPIEAKITKGMSVVNIASTSKPKNLVQRLSISSKSMDARKYSLSQSVAVSIDPNACQSTNNINISESKVLSSEHNIKQNELSENASIASFPSKYPCIFQELSRTQSLSSLLVRKLSLQSIQPYFIHSCNNLMEYDANNPVFNANVQIATKSSDFSNNSRKVSPRNVKKLDTKSVNCKTLNNYSRSSKCLNSPIVTNGSLKLSISESEIKQSPFYTSLSPNITPSNSDAFLSPIVTEIMSSGENTDWKSPIEPISGVSSSQNLTPHIDNAIPLRNSRIWCTPPSPK